MEMREKIQFADVITAQNIEKKYGKFVLNIEDFHVPAGYATALIGENGAGKSTLLDILSGVRLDYKGRVDFFRDDTETGSFDGLGQDKKNRGNVDPFAPGLVELRERIGFTSPNDFFPPDWTVKQVEEASELLFSNFDREKFNAIVSELDIPTDRVGKKWKKVSQLSDGNKMKLELATVLARDTDLLILDEPASPLDPLMRDKLCDIIRRYMDEKQNRSVFFSTHNIADMENVTDYVIIMENGEVIETGFTEDLKEKYVMVKADASASSELENVLIGARKTSVGIEGLMEASNKEIADRNGAVCEVPNLTEISVCLMKQHSHLG